ncbi:MAG TPA: PAS domain-containing protein [Dongiaceae bacterium]|nr:PAS domain-containing protein [Dongiaceae bacterium]
MRPRIERAAEVQPHLTEERYRALAETLRAVPWEGEPTTDHVTYVGPQIERLTGYTVEEWRAPGAWVNAMHPDDRDGQVQKYEWHLKHHSDHNLEYRVIARSGQQIWFRDIITFVTNADGHEIVRGLMIVIDEEKALERALRESEARYGHAERIAKLVHWSLALDPHGNWENNRLTYSNAAVELLGLPPDRLHLTNGEFLARLTHPEDHEHVRSTLHQSLAKGQIEISVTYRIVRPDGRIRWVVEHAHNDFDETGRRVGAFGIIQDITEQRQRELEMREAYLRADLASRAKTQFLATMSHELRTPLNAIIGFSEVMRAEIMGPLGSPGYKDYAADIHGSGTFLLAIINELLDLSLIDSGEMKLDESLVQIDKIAESSVALLRSKAAAKGIKLTQAASCNPPLLRGDARRIKQAVINLLTNAIKFTPAGGSVDVSASWSGSGMVLTVSDTGIGIAAADLERVMKPFVQAENWLARKHEGAGLGLAITKSICELHGGTLVLESTVGEGTVARILLPADRVEARPRAT